MSGRRPRHHTRPRLRLRQARAGRGGTAPACSRARPSTSGACSAMRPSGHDRPPARVPRSTSTSTGGPPELRQKRRRLLVDDLAQAGGALEGERRRHLARQARPRPCPPGRRRRTRPATARRASRTKLSSSSNSASVSPGKPAMKVERTAAPGSAARTRASRSRIGGAVARAPHAAQHGAARRAAGACPRRARRAPPGPRRRASDDAVRLQVEQAQPVRGGRQRLAAPPAGGSSPPQPGCAPARRVLADQHQLAGAGGEGAARRAQAPRAAATVS